MAFLVSGEALEIPRFLLNSESRPRKPMKVIAHISVPTFYLFEGWLFEYSSAKPFGPWPCTKDFEPRKRAGKKFYNMFSRFKQLTVVEQNNLEI